MTARSRGKTANETPTDLPDAPVGWTIFGQANSDVPVIFVTRSDNVTQSG